ncbi:MAG: glycoside hydrolase family 127 protein [Anaerolineae bacterium]|nr:glycoside hydrolase family 127 protein [Anaerolineae bacterium]
MEIDTTHSPHAHLKTIPLKNVSVRDGFWSGRQATNHDIGLKHAYRKLEESGNFNNLKLAAGSGVGEYHEPPFMDSDIYKWLEAVSYELVNSPDPELENMVNDAIDLLAAAQQENGYLNSYFQVVKPEKKWQELAMGHELYCAGHLFEAAVAHHRATGKTVLLDIACRFADHIDAAFGPGKRDAVPGHPEIELALVELSRETGEQRYLKLAGFFIDQRGRGKMIGATPFDAGYHQDRVLVREAEIVEGHAVRQLYLLAGVADVYLETGEKALLEVAKRLWRDMTARKMYLTAGFGARHYGESFGEAYELPSDTAYAETCAAIANIMWNWRMLAITGEARYADLIESSLYNGFLSGISLDGQRYFYVNPLSSQGGIERSEWYGCACCPPNVMRQIALLGHYIATTRENGLQIHQYIASDIAADLGHSNPVKVRLETSYPWEGKGQLVIEETDESPWELALRIPPWCDEASVQIGDKVIDVSTNAGSYAKFKRTWKPGDMAQLHLQIRPRFIKPNPRVDAIRSTLAIAYGPLVYCFEGIDQPEGVSLSDVRLRPSISPKAIWREDLLGRVMEIKAQGAVENMSSWEDMLYRTLSPASPSYQDLELTATPYYAWANRVPGTMRVWIPCI